MININEIFNKFLTPYLAEDIDIRNIVHDILGTTDPHKISELINQTVSPYLKNDIEKILFLEPCIGAVFGFLLTSGQKIILKIYNRKNTCAYLDEMNRIQQIFVNENYPAPKPLSPIFTFYNTHAGLYGFIEGKKENSHNPAIRAELAKYLAKFTEIVKKHQFKPIKTFMQESMQGKLWPVPHNVMFDLNKTSRGAGWIANHAKQARKIINTYNFPHQLAHCDWDVKNTIFKDNKLVGVFDWDSLGSMSEPEMVGRAASQFTADWESGNKVTPTPDEGRAFVAEYESHRGNSFTPDEYKVVSASADYLIALISRFEHSGTNASVHPFQDLLKECYGKSFLFA
jgi:hypothetical protein